MKEWMRRVSAFFMAAVLLISTSAVSVLAETAAPPNSIAESSSNWGYDFKIVFPQDASDWLSAVTGVTVGDTPYTKGSSSYSVWNNTAFYADPNNHYLLIGEGAVSDTADCVVTAEGYMDLTLELNKSTHTAAIKSGQGGPVEHIHTGGTATCLKKAVCTVCNEEYGELGDHTFVNGKCTVCGYEKNNVPAVTVDNSESTYFILKIASSDYMEGISAVLCNGEKLEETSYKIALSGQKYYLDKINNAVYFDKMSGIPFKSGDIITIEHPEYKDLRLKIAIAAGEVTVTPVDQDVEQGDEYALHVRLVGYFESALVNQKGYDAISSASTNVTQNKNSDVSVEAVLLPKDEEPADDDWKLLNESGIAVDVKNTKVNIDAGSGMAGVYSVYDSSITLAGTPEKAGEYKVSVTVTDDQGRTATSNELIFKVYSGEEYLEDQLVLENCTPTADGKYMYDMEPWAIKNFNSTDNVVTVPAGIKAWYGSHTSGTYGELGYAVPWGSDTVQTLVIPKGCSLTFVNMDILSSVRIVVEEGGTLVLRDSTVQGIVDVHSGGVFSMNYNESGGTGEFLTGASINGQVILRDGATLENAKIYSNTNFIPNGSEARKNTNPVVVAEGNVTISGQVFIRGDEAATGTDSSTGKSFAGQSGLLVKDGALNITEGSVLAVYGGGYDATTSVGGTAVILENASITGAGKLIAVGGQGTFDDGGNAVEGSGTIATANAYLEGGNSYQPKEGSSAGEAMTDGVALSGNTNRNLIDGKVINSESDNVDTGTYWGSITEIPDLSLYVVDNNAPGEIPDEIPVTGITLNKENMELNEEGAGETLIAAVLPDNASNKKVTWSSGDASVATVDEDGKVTAVANGTTVITVTTEDGNLKASCTVTVNIPTVSVTPPQIIEGMNSSWKKGTDVDLRFKSDVPFADLICVTVDGAVLDSANYTVSEEGTVAVLKASYLETLTVGTHTLTISSQNGDASTQFVILEKEVSEPVPDNPAQDNPAQDNPTQDNPAQNNPNTTKDNVAAVNNNNTASVNNNSSTSGGTNSGAKTVTPHTGDSSQPLLWFMVAVVSVAGISMLAVYGKRRKNSAD